MDAFGGGGTTLPPAIISGVAVFGGSGGVTVSIARVVAVDGIFDSFPSEVFAAVSGSGGRSVFSGSSSEAGRFSLFTFK